MAPPVYSPTLILSGEPSSDSSSFSVKRVGETLIHFSMFFFVTFAQKRLGLKKFLKSAAGAAERSYYIHLQMHRYFIRISPPKKQHPKIPPGKTVPKTQKAGWYLPRFFSLYFFFLTLSSLWQVNIFLRAALQLLKGSFTKGEPKDGLSLRNWLRLRGGTFSGSHSTWCRIQPLPPCSASEWHPIHPRSPQPPVESLHSSPSKRHTCCLLTLYF